MVFTSVFLFALEGKECVCVWGGGVCGECVCKTNSLLFTMAREKEKVKAGTQTTVIFQIT